MGGAGFDGRLAARLEESLCTPCQRGRQHPIRILTEVARQACGSTSGALHAIPYPVRLPPLSPMPDWRVTRVSRSWGGSSPARAPKWCSEPRQRCLPRCRMPASCSWDAMRSHRARPLPRIGCAARRSASAWRTRSSSRGSSTERASPISYVARACVRSRRAGRASATSSRRPRPRAGRSWPRRSRRSESSSRTASPAGSLRSPIRMRGRRALIELLRDRDKAAAMGKAGAAHVAAHQRAWTCRGSGNRCPSARHRTLAARRACR